MINNEDGSIEQVPSTDIRARTYRGTEPVDAAIDWINQQPTNQPWMVSLAFATAHTPVMQPPIQLLPPSEPDTSNLDCSNSLDQRIMTNQMEEALDTEVGRLLVATGLASRGSEWPADLPPASKPTPVIVFVTDNGSNGAVVKAPFDASRVEIQCLSNRCMVSRDRRGSGSEQARPRGECDGQYRGPLPVVRRAGRHRRAPERTADRRRAVHCFRICSTPRSRASAKPTLPQIGTNLHANGEINGPCQFNTTTCTQIAPTKGVCEDNSGIWWGPGATDPSTAGIPADGLQLCCDVAVWQANHAQTISTNIYPLEAVAIRNANYKIVINSYEAYDATSNSCVATSTNEFYQINENVPVPKLDTADADLLATGTQLNRQQKKNYAALTAQLAQLLASQPACPGDINLDGVVNNADIAEWQMFQAAFGALKLGRH